MRTLFLIMVLATSPAPTTVVTEMDAEACMQNHRDYWGGLAVGVAGGQWLATIEETGEQIAITDLRCVESLPDRIGAGV